MKKPYGIDDLIQDIPTQKLNRFTSGTYLHTFGNDRYAHVAKFIPRRILLHC